MNKLPRGWPRIAVAAFYDDAGAAIDWLVKTFGFEVVLRIEGEGGRIEHSELAFGNEGEAMIMVGSSGGKGEGTDPSGAHRQSPRAVGGVNTQSMCVTVDDVDAHFARARAAGATIVKEPTTSDYGEDYWVDRSYEAVDLEGHHWWFMQRLREPKTKTKQGAGAGK
jgi:uncharacterized glyoxalase superfamily protein PhnB